MADFRGRPGLVEGLERYEPAVLTAVALR